MLNGDNVHLELITEQTLASYIRLESDLSNRGDFAPLELVSEQMLKRQFRETGFWDHRGGRLLIYSNSTGTIVGSISFFRTTHYFSAFEIGFIIYEAEHRGKGFMKESVKLLTDYLFESRQITRLEIRFVPSNCASRTIAESAGYTFESINRAVRRKGNTLVDLELFVQTVDEWEELNRGNRSGLSEIYTTPHIS